MMPNYNPAFGGYAPYYGDPAANIPRHETVKVVPVNYEPHEIIDQINAVFAEVPGEGS